MRKILIFIFLVSLFFINNICNSYDINWENKLIINNKEIGYIDGEVLDWILIGKDWKNYSFVYEKNWISKLIINSKEIAHFKWKIEDFLISEGWKSYAYKINWKWKISLNNKKTISVEWNLKRGITSENRTDYYWYISEKNWVYLLIINGKKIISVKSYDDLIMTKNSIYGYKINWSWVIIKNNKKYINNNNIKNFNITWDWKNYIFIYEKNWIKELIINWKKIASITWKVSNITISWDWKNYGFVYEKNWIKELIINLKKITSITWKVSNLNVSWNWKNYSFISKENWINKIIINWEKVISINWNITNLKTSLDWKIFAYKMNWKWIFVVNGKKVAYNLNYYDFKITQNSKSYAYKLNWKWIVIINNKRIILNNKRFISSFDITEDWKNYIYTSKKLDLLPITSKIKSPKTISKNPYLIFINILFALLYLLVFYFISQLFNSYFDELSSKNKWNEKISSFLHKILIKPLQKMFSYFYKKTKKSKIKKSLKKLKIFFIKYEHKIYIIIWFFILWIIWQIIVDDFDIFSLKGWITIIIMIFILGFITLFKDILLYITNKGKEKEDLKLKNMPIWFIFAFIIAVFWRIIWLIPWVMFGTTIGIDTKKSITARKLWQPKLLIKILFWAFMIWIIVWFLTIFFNPESFIYKFLIVVYFWLINDVFFNLLPFWLLWWVFILKDNKMKKKWFLFTFIVFFFLLHTILHSEWDLNKLLQFDWNFLILISILIFWIIITWILYVFKKQDKNNNN